MKARISLIAAAALLAPAIGLALIHGSNDALGFRYFTAEIAPGTTLQVGVKLPRSAKIARTRVFADDEDLGGAKDWMECDIEKRTCAIGDMRILRFHRERRDDWQELAADLRNESGETRYAKVLVLYQNQSGFDRSGCGPDHVCGFAREAAR